MTNKELKKHIEKLYWKNNQTLKCTAWCDEKYHKKDKSYFSQEIFVEDESYIIIQTWDCFIEDYNKISYTPYCKKTYWGGFLITVPKFGQLNDDDIANAIYYVLNETYSDLCMIRNVTFEGRKMIRPNYDYKLDQGMLQCLREHRRYYKK